MPENIRAGVTITPPDGEPVTGTAIPEFNSSNSAVIFYYPLTNPTSLESGGQIMPAGWNLAKEVETTTTTLNITLPAGYYSYSIMTMTDKADEGAITISNAIKGNKTFNPSYNIYTGTFDSIGYNTKTVTGVIQVSNGFSITYTKVDSTGGAPMLIFIYQTDSDDISENNIVSDININGIIGTMNKNNNSNVAVVGGYYTGVSWRRNVAMCSDTFDSYSGNFETMAFTLNSGITSANYIAYSAGGAPSATFKIGGQSYNVTQQIGEIDSAIGTVLEDITLNERTNSFEFVCIFV